MYGCHASRAVSARASSNASYCSGGKRDLFERIAQVTSLFVLGDVVVPERPEDAVVEIDWVEDLPSSVPEQLGWLDEAGFDAEASYVRPDLAVFVARRRPLR